MQCAQKSANPDKESVNRSEVGQSRQEVGKVRLLVGISVIMAEVGSASESSLLGHHNYVWWPRRLLSEALPTSAIITEIPIALSGLYRLPGGIGRLLSGLPTPERTALRTCFTSLTNVFEPFQNVQKIIEP